MDSKEIEGGCIVAAQCQEGCHEWMGLGRKIKCHRCDAEREVTTDENIAMAEAAIEENYQDRPLGRNA